MPWHAEEILRRIQAREEGDRLRSLEVPEPVDNPVDNGEDDGRDTYDPAEARHQQEICDDLQREDYDR